MNEIQTGKINSESIKQLLFVGLILIRKDNEEGCDKVVNYIHRKRCKYYRIEKTKIMLWGPPTEAKKATLQPGRNLNWPDVITKDFKRKNIPSNRKIILETLGRIEKTTIKYMNTVLNMTSQN